MKKMNILYSIDEGKKDYSRYLGVSILSLLENNKGENLHIYILSKYIEESNKKELIRLVESFGKKISFSNGGEIIPEDFKVLLFQNGRHNMATYYRLFFYNHFDIYDRILYLDCDTIVNRNLSEFYNTDFEGNVLVCNKDLPITVYMQNKKYGLTNYMNAGVLLINCKLFKEVDFLKEILNINSRYDEFLHVDQDYLNIIFNGRIKFYEKLQYIVFFKWGNMDYSDYFVIHTIVKPNLGGYSQCPKEIECLFDSYLRKTKRVKYVGWEKDFGIKDFLNYYYVNINRFLLYFFLKFFGVRVAYKYHIVSSYFTRVLLSLLSENNKCVP